MRAGFALVMRRAAVLQPAKSAFAMSRSRTRAARTVLERFRSHHSPPARRWRSSARTAPARRRSPSCSAGSTTRSPARSRSTASTSATFDLASRGDRGSPPSSRTFIRFELSAARQRRAGRRARRGRAAGARVGRRGGPREPGHGAGPRLRRRHRSLGRPMAARRARARAVRREPRAPAWCCSTSRPRSSTCAAKRRSSIACSTATRQCTTILISHRFSTVRHADRICVLEHGRVIELGTHDELMALGGRYRTMFDLQAQRFDVGRRRGGDDAMTSSPDQDARDRSR